MRIYVVCSCSAKELKLQNAERALPRAYVPVVSTSSFKRCQKTRSSLQKISTGQTRHAMKIDEVWCVSIFVAFAQNPHRLDTFLRFRFQNFKVFGQVGAGILAKKGVGIWEWHWECIGMQTDSPSFHEATTSCRAASAWRMDCVEVCDCWPYLAICFFILRCFVNGMRSSSLAASVSKGGKKLVIVRPTQTS